MKSRPFPRPAPVRHLAGVNLIALWIATLGADRIDLLGGAAPFALLPFHLLTAAVVAVEWRRRLRAGSVGSISAAQGTYGVLVLGMLAFAAASVLRSGDILLSTNRVILFAGTAIGASLAIWGMSDREDLLLLLSRGARLGLAAALCFDVIQLLSFARILPENLQLGPVNIFIASYSYGIIPRLTGLGADMNGSGGALLTQTVLIALAGPQVRFRRAWVVLGAFLVFVTLSRSSLLAAIPVLLLFPKVMPAGRSARLALAAAGLALAASTAALLHDQTRASVGRALAPLAGRLDPNEGSARIHVHLIFRGIEEATQDVARTLLGMGYGSSHRVLADLFPGTKYGNFHSLYVQLWVESGILPLLLFVVLLVLSVQRTQALRGLMLGFIVYNVFYQGLIQPVFWVAVALVWFAAEQVEAPWLHPRASTRIAA
jgi:hypothetical protein